MSERRSMKADADRCRWNRCNIILIGKRDVIEFRLLSDCTIARFETMQMATGERVSKRSMKADFCNADLWLGPVFVVLVRGKIIKVCNDKRKFANGLV